MQFNKYQIGTRSKFLLKFSTSKVAVLFMFSCSYTVLKSNSFFKIASLSLRLTRSPEWWRHLRRSQLAISTLRPIRLLIPVIPIRIGRYNCKNVSLALFLYGHPILFGQLDLRILQNVSYFATLVWISISATRRRSNPLER